MVATQRFRYGTEPTSFGDLRLPDGIGPHPVVVLIHGGFWRAQYGLDLMGRLGDDLAARGFASWNIEYRRGGEPGGGWPGTLQDVARATERLRDLAPEHALDLGRVVTLGHSAGGHLALWVAARPRLPVGALGTGDMGALTGPSALRVVGAISQAGAADLAECWRQGLGRGAVAELLGGTPDEVPERYAAADPARALPLGIRQALVHGTLDDVVPLDISERYVAAAIEAGDDARLRPIAGADHRAVIDPTTPAWAACVEELLRMVPRDR